MYNHEYLRIYKEALRDYRDCNKPIRSDVLGDLISLLEEIEQESMPCQKVTMFIPKKTVDKYNHLLDMKDMDFENEGIDEDAVLKTYTFRFANGIEADIKVCSGQTNLFVDPVLFHNGCECCVLETADTVDGEYSFEYNDVIYTAVLVGA